RHDRVERRLYQLHRLAQALTYHRRDLSASDRSGPKAPRCVLRSKDLTTDEVAGRIVAAHDDVAATTAGAGAADLRALAPNNLRVVASVAFEHVPWRVGVARLLAGPHVDGARGVDVGAGRQVLAIAGAV